MQYRMQRKAKKVNGLKRRVHIMQKDGSCKQAPYLVDESGKLEDYAVTNPAEMSADFIQTKGGVIVSPAALNNSIVKLCK